MVGENGQPSTPDWHVEPRPDMLASLIRGLEQAAAGLTMRRDDFLDEPHITRGTN